MSNSRESNKAMDIPENHFGSFAKGKQEIDSDIDLLVEFKAPRFDWMAGLQIYLEEKLGRSFWKLRLA